MRAVVVRDGELVVEDRPDPVAGDTELLVAVRAAALNRADLLQRRGRYPAPPGAPTDIPGMEVAGEVVSVGRQARRFSVGDRIMALVGGGAQATMAVADEAHALAVPDGLSWEATGGFPEVFSTAYDALFPRAQLGVGDRVLVTGAAGGVGTAAVQLAAAAGAEVVASVRDPARHAAVEALGARHVVGPDGIGDHAPYDVVLELVGAASLTDALPMLAMDGRVVVIGTGAGSRVEVNLLALMQRRGVLTGATLRGRTRTEKGIVADAMAHHVVPLLAAGRIRVPVSNTFPLTDVTAAYECFDAGGKLGKIVLMT